MNHKKLVALQIDGKEVKVPQGTSIIEAAAQANIEIPHLCWLEGLPGIGACRLCLVEVEGARDLVVSCTRRVEEGMVVRTQTERVLEARRFILELLWSIHPGDCTTCEKSGRCELQEYTYELNVDKKRFPLVPTEEYPRDTSNPLIERDMNLCILCGRCIRICQTQGKYVLDFVHRGMVTKVTTPFEKPLQEVGCTFCGSCISVCPVGCLIEKDRRRRGREWEFKTTKTACPHCGCACDLLLDTVNEQIIRARPEKINGYLCVKGKFGWDYLLSTERLETPLIRRDGSLVPCTWEEALDYIATGLEAIKKARGPQALGGLISATYPTETLYLFGKFFRACLGTNTIDSSARLLNFPTLAGFLQTFGGISVIATLSEIAEADTLLIIDSDVTVSYPAVGVKVKEALRRGARLITIDPRRTEIAQLSQLHLQPQPGTEATLLTSLINVILDEKLYDQEFVTTQCTGFEEIRSQKSEVRDQTGVPREDLREAARLYAEKEKKAIILFSAEAADLQTVSSIATLLMLTGRVKGGAFPCLLSSNLWGAAAAGAGAEFYPGYRKVEDEAARKALQSQWGVSLPSRPGLSALEMIQSDSISGMYILGENPVASFPERTKIVEKLSALELLVVQDLFVTETAQLAHVVLPSASFAESSGTFINAEGKVQRLTPAIRPLARPDWQIIAELSSRLCYPMKYNSEDEIAQEITEIQRILSSEGRKYRVAVPPISEPDEKPDREYPYRLMLGTTLFGFGDGSWTRRSKISLLEAPALGISPQDAQALGIADGALVSIASRRGRITAPAKIHEALPPGLVFLPMHFPECNLLTSAQLDPKTKSPKFKLTAVKLIPQR